MQPAFTSREASCLSVDDKKTLALFTMVTCWSRSTSHFFSRLIKIWKVNSNGKCTQLLETCLLIAEAERVTYYVFNWIYKMKQSCYQDSSDIRGWFVYWVFGRETRRLSKSSEIIVFKNELGVEKSQAILALLGMAFRNWISTGKLE